MTPSRSVTAIVLDAIELEVGERRAFLESACGVDTKLRADVE